MMLQDMVNLLPKLIPAATTCLEGTLAVDKQSTKPPAPAVAAAALDLLATLLSSMRSTMRPYLRSIEAVAAPWLQVR